MSPHLRVCIPILAISICLLSTSCAGALDGGPSGLNMAISRIDTIAPVPYVEMEALNYETTVYDSSPITWLWLSSSQDQGPRQEISRPILVQVDNRTVPVAQSLVRLESYSTDKGAVSPRWTLVPRNEYTYAFGFMIALNVSVAFENPTLFVGFYNRELEDQWTHVETLTRLDTAPDNVTLAYWGLQPSDFAAYAATYHYKTFYLYEVTLSRNSYFVERLSYTFQGPAIALALLLAGSIIVLIFGRMSLSNALTLYLGSAFFSLPFLLNYAQLGLGQVSIVEKVFYIDIYLATVLAFVSLAFNLGGKRDNESFVQFLKRVKYPAHEEDSPPEASKQH